MIGNKLKEVQTGKAFFSFSSNLDNVIRTKVFVGRKIITEFPKHFFREAFHFSIQKIYSGFEKFMEFFYPKISHIIETVKGKDIPKNKGNSSFFLENIKEHKKNLKR